MQINRLIAPLRGLAPWLCAALLSSACGGSANAEMRARTASIERASDPTEALKMARDFASIGDLMRAEQYLRLAIKGGAEEREVMPLLVQFCVRDQRYLDAVQ